MALLHKILAATDFSESADAAITHAIALAYEAQASLTLLYVYQVMPYTEVVGFASFEPRLHESHLHSSERVLLQAKAEAEQQGVAQVGIALEQGTPYHTITKFAKEGNYDLIVVGTHGRTGIRHTLIGSVAERVVRHAHCPVLVVRQPQDVSSTERQDHEKR
jgi:nucleotide-binding universal stress UspA family protein